MKVFKVLFITAILVLGLSACKSGGVNYPADPPPVIVNPLDYKAVAGEVISVTPLCDNAYCGEKSVVTLRFALGGCIRDLDYFNYRVIKRRSEVIVEAYYLNPPLGTACTMDAFLLDQEITVDLEPPFTLYFSGTDEGYEVDDYFAEDED